MRCYQRHPFRPPPRVGAPNTPDTLSGVPHLLDSHFDDLRRRRANLYKRWDRSQGARKSRALLTYVHNEPVFFPIWLGYYSRFFAPEDIYVLDHDTTDGSLSGSGFVRIPVSHPSVDNQWFVRIAEEHQHELIERYDVVVVTDSDEIIAPDPRWGTLGDYIDRIDEKFVTCYGHELLHMRDEEPPYDADRPVMDQRSYWYENGLYDKPSIAMAPMEWVVGFHTPVDGSVNFDPDLYLIHLHRMDYDVCLERHRLRNRRPWNPKDVQLQWGRQNLIVEDEEFDRWFYQESLLDDCPIVLERIPEYWRGTF